MKVEPIRILLVIASGLVSSGCAIRYTNPENGEEHLWGFGHISVRSEHAPSSHHATIRSAATLGLEVNLGREEYGVAAGASRTRRTEISPEDVRLKLIWNGPELLEIQLGNNSEF